MARTSPRPLAPSRRIAVPQQTTFRADFVL
jgi:hypothetical protein